MHPLTLKCKTQYDSCEVVTAVSLTCHSLLTSMLLIISGLMNSSQSRLLYWVRYAKKNVNMLLSQQLQVSASFEKVHEECCLFSGVQPVIPVKRISEAY